VLAPILAGALLPVITLTGILAIDVITFFFAIGALLIVHVPQPEKTVEGQKEKGNIWKEAAYGFTYIFKRPSLLGMQLVFFMGNLFSGIGFTVYVPMILLRTNDNSVILGSVNSAHAIGGVVGGILMSAWAGFKKRSHGVLVGWIVFGILWVCFGLGTSLAFWIPFAVLSALTGPLINTSNQSLWQAKVAPDLQGRVFSARRLIAWFTNPISPIIAGVLADQWLEPSMTSGTTGLSHLFEPIVGNGPGRAWHCSSSSVVSLPRWLVSSATSSLPSAMPTQCSPITTNWKKSANRQHLKTIIGHRYKPGTQRPGFVFSTDDGRWCPTPPDACSGLTCSPC